MAELHFYVPSLCCRHCADAIAAAVGAVPGVDQIVVDPISRWVSVAGPVLDINSIRTAVARTGHPGEL